MKTVKCVGCKSVFAYVPVDDRMYDITVGCPHCGFKDYAYVFHNKHELSKLQASDLIDSFLSDLSDFCDKIEQSDVNVVVQKLAGSYGISKDSVVLLIDRMLRRSEYHSRPNPLRFKHLVEDTVSVSQLMRSNQEVLTGLPTSDHSSYIEAPADDSSPWRHRCENLEAELDKLRKENAELVEQLQVKQKEIAEYRSILGE